VKDVGFIVEYSSEERFVSFSENVSDCGNAISTVSVVWWMDRQKDSISV